ncbi:MAG: hypothetical protein C0392_04890 [Syntrophus sp. (in: bacteria)]|nr:hypothetical protein [Syntrophus sp. (in: bacteria)]
MIHDEEKTREELIKELAELRQQAAEAEISENRQRQTDEALRESEERLRTVLEAVKEGITFSDENGHFEAYNSEMERLTGYSIDEANARSDFTVLLYPDADNREKALKGLNELYAIGMSREVETRIRTKDGKQKYVLVSTTLVPYKGRRMFLSSYHDITERKETEKNLIESEERYRTAIEHSNDGVALVRGDQHIYVNRKFLKIFGYDSAEEVIGKTHSLTVHPDDLEMVIGYNIMRQRGEPVASRYEFKGIRKDRTPIYVEVSSTRTTFMGETVTLAYFRETTKRKLAEEDLRKHKEHLEELVEARTVELKIANERLQQEIDDHSYAEEKIHILNQELKQRIQELKAINEGLEAFGYSLSHDLRTPLVAIGGFSRRLLEKHGYCLDEKGQQYLKIINENSMHMEALISNLLAFFRSGNKTINSSRIKMNSMVREIGNQLKTIYQDRTIQLNIKNLPDGKGDKIMLGQVLTNLMSNAVKYSKPGEIIVIELAGWVEEEENIYYVKDNGIGFPIEHVNRLFETFERLHTRDEIEGTGLGLAIVKRVIQRHGGRVWAESKVGEGATFYFSLPR